MNQASKQDMKSKPNQPCKPTYFKKSVCCHLLASSTAGDGRYTTSLTEGSLWDRQAERSERAQHALVDVIAATDPRSIGLAVATAADDERGHQASQPERDERLIRDGQRRAACMLIAF